MFCSDRQVIIVVGPTAVGKTRLGASLGEAFGGEVISVDSLQCYKLGTIVTAQPQPDEIRDVPHHLLNYLDAEEEPHVDFVERAMGKIEEIHNRNIIPILVGGSISLYNLLLPEIFQQGYQATVISLSPCMQSDEYFRRVKKRIDDMVERGLLQELRELKSLKESYKGDSQPGNNQGVWKAIGYQELEPYLLCASDQAHQALLLEIGLIHLRANTLQYAMAQLRWTQNHLNALIYQHGGHFINITVKAGGERWRLEVEAPVVRICSELCFAIRFGPIVNYKSTHPTICVFGGSSPGHKSAHVTAAKSLAKVFHDHSVQLVYGGGTTGMMGTLAKELVALSGPDAVHGVIPYTLAKFEASCAGGGQVMRNDPLFGRRTIVKDMHTRKQLMVQTVLRGGPNSGFVGISGGYGTMEELLEIITWKQLGIHNAPVCVLNVLGFYDDLLAWIGKLHDEGFMDHSDATILAEASTPEQVIDCLRHGEVGSRKHSLEWNLPI